ERAFYPYYVRRAAALGISAVDDQMLGAGLMWSGGHMYLLPILLILWGLARDAMHERDDAVEGREEPTRAVLGSRRPGRAQGGSHGARTGRVRRRAARGSS